MGGTVVCKGNVTLQRGDQFLHADSLRFDSENSTYTADGNVRYQDSSMRMVAESAHGDQTRDTHQINDVRYQLIERRGNGAPPATAWKGTRARCWGRPIRPGRPTHATRSGENTSEPQSIK